MRSAVVLLSGGIDSAVSAFQAREDLGKKGELHSLTISYGQRHLKEVNHSAEIARLLGASPILFSLDLRELVKSSLLVTSTGAPIEDPRTTGLEAGIPSSWVPQRNSMFFTLAFAYAEMVGADLVYAGLNCRDYSGYPDCRPEFVGAINKALNLASKRSVETGRGVGIVCPLLYKGKSEIVKLGTLLGVPFELTWSCYMGREKACGICDSCRIRLEAFKDLGLIDPLEYEVIDQVG